MSDEERCYLFYLAGEVPGPPSAPPRDVRPGILHLLGRLDDTPALVLDAKYDVLAWNPQAAALIGDFSRLPEGERNLVWAYFTDPRARERHDDEGAWRFARVAVADLRAAAARYPDDPGIRRLVRRLRKHSEEFARLWRERDVRVSQPARKRLRHPVVGWLELDCETLHVPESDQCVVFYSAPPGSPSADALRLLAVVGVQDLAAPERNTVGER